MQASQTRSSLQRLHNLGQPVLGVVEDVDFPPSTECRGEGRDIRDIVLDKNDLARGDRGHCQVRRGREQSGHHLVFESHGQTDDVQIVERGVQASNWGFRHGMDYLCLV